MCNMIMNYLSFIVLILTIMVSGVVVVLVETNISISAYDVFD